MKSQCRLIIAAISLIFTWTAAAETIYKSVDEQGRVTYSSSPPASSGTEMIEEVPIAPGPTEQEVQQTDQRFKELQEVTQRAEQLRQDQRQKDQKAVSVAEKELRNAEIALQEARIKGDGDWQHLAAGGRVLKPSYLDRVKNAEQRVQQAKKRLSDARSSGP